MLNPDRTEKHYVPGKWEIHSAIRKDVSGWAWVEVDIRFISVRVHLHLDRSFDDINEAWAFFYSFANPAEVRHYVREYALKLLEGCGNEI